jgi:hypothetical protein
VGDFVSAIVAVLSNADTAVQPGCTKSVSPPCYDQTTSSDGPIVQSRPKSAGAPRGDLGSSSWCRTGGDLGLNAVQRQITAVYSCRYGPACEAERVCAVTVPPPMGQGCGKLRRGLRTRRDRISDRQSRNDGRPMFIRLDLEISSQLTYSLTYPPKTDATARGCHTLALILRYSLAIISDLNSQLILVPVNPYSTRTAT